MRMAARGGLLYIQCRKTHQLKDNPQISFQLKARLAKKEQLSTLMTPTLWSTWQASFHLTLTTLRDGYHYYLHAANEEPRVPGHMERWSQELNPNHLTPEEEAVTTSRNMSTKRRLYSSNSWGLLCLGHLPSPTPLEPQLIFFLRTDPLISLQTWASFSHPHLTVLLSSMVFSQWFLLVFSPLALSLAHLFFAQYHHPSPDTGVTNILLQLLSHRLPQLEPETFAFLSDAILEARRLIITTITNAC